MANTPYNKATVSSDTNPLRGLRQAFADTFDNSPYYDEERCLSFLMAEWVNAKYAQRAASLIGDYSFAFRVERVNKAIRMIAEAYPMTAFAFGRERSVVLYIETDAPEAILETMENVANPQEAWVLDPEKEHHQFGRDDVNHTHSSCRHFEPPLEHHEFVGQREGPADYVRIWWDS